MDNLPYALDAALGGWTLTGINTMYSGQTVNFRYTPVPVTANLPSFIGGVALRPNLVGNPMLSEGRTIDRWFNTEAVRLPAGTSRSATPGATSDAARRSINSIWDCRRTSRCR